MIITKIYVFLKQANVRWKIDWHDNQNDEPSTRYSTTWRCPSRAQFAASSASPARVSSSIGPDSIESYSASLMMFQKRI
jgi:hypothetical protein